VIFRKLSYEKSVLLRMLLVILPCACIAILLLSGLSVGRNFQKLLVLFAILISLVLAWRFARQLLFPLNTVANLLEALREGDYTLRASGSNQSGAMGALIRQVNTLAETLKSERLRAEEAGALLNKVLDEVDVSVLAFDQSGVLKLANASAMSLFKLSEKSIGKASASDLGLLDFLAGPAERVEPHGFPGAQGRFEIHRRAFRDRGREHQLLVMSDMTRALREEERGAWQRLIRVLGHELNNSLTPIRSMAQTLSSMLAREQRADDWESDLKEGLTTIGERAGGLSRFMTAYATLARLPPPKFAEVELAPMLRKLARFDPRMAAQLDEGGDVRLSVDADQLEQALINLIKNAVEAALMEKGAGVKLRWRVDKKEVQIQVLDDGPGLANSDNLFVPFFTTKPGGSGIGLVLARQIVEAHGGRLSLSNRIDHRGCIAAIELPR
jgi:two-component system, NtrC family, nitrogen regulation sensor histidine kinase NtrY